VAQLGITPMSDEAAKGLGDLLSMAVVIGSLVEILPAIAAGLSIIWTTIRIVEWVGRKWM